MPLTPVTATSPLPVAVSVMFPLAKVVDTVVLATVKLPRVKLPGLLVTPSAPTYSYPATYTTLPAVSTAGIVSPMKLSTPACVSK